MRKVFAEKGCKFSFLLRTSGSCFPEALKWHEREHKSDKLSDKTEHKICEICTLNTVIEVAHTGGASTDYEQTQISNLKLEASQQLPAPILATNDQVVWLKQVRYCGEPYN